MSPESPTRCARCGEAPVEGCREEMPVCPTCEVTVLRDLLTDRERELAALRHDLAQARAQRGAAERQAAANYASADELRRAAEALLRGLLDTLSDGALWPCDCAGERGADGCEGIAAVRVYDEPDTTDLCGHCAERLDRSHLESRPHAAPLRALRALLGVTP